MTAQVKSINNGIQGNVEAKVVAVGEGASATLYETNTSGISTDDLVRLLNEISRAVKELHLNDGAEKNIQADIDKIQQVALDNQADKSGLRSVIEHLREKIELIGGLVSDTAAVAEPIARVIKLLTALPF